MEIVTSWEKQGAKKAYSLREGLSVETVIKITALKVERVQDLKAELKAGYYTKSFHIIYRIYKAKYVNQSINLDDRQKH